MLSFGKYLKNIEKTSLLPIHTTKYTFHTLINLLPIITNITTVDLKKQYDQGYSNHLKTLPQLPKYYNLHLFLSGTSFFIYIHVLIILDVSYAFISSRSVSPIVIIKILRHCLYLVLGKKKKPLKYKITIFIQQKSYIYKS